MRHSHQAMIDTIDTFLKSQCDPFDRNKCLEIHDKRPSEKNICNQSFKLPSALCGLGFTGEEDPYDQIADSDVKKGCKDVYEHNKKVLTISVVSE